ncbi:MAG: hypothetical protein AMXMBFR12_00290 [Candidatus Babeliales bacterium]
MLKKHYSIWLFLGSFLLMLPSCKRPSYMCRNFESLTPAFSGQQTKENVTVKIAPLSKQESQAFFDHRGHRLHSKRKPLRPVMVSIQNESDKTYTFDLKSMEIKLANPRSAARRMYGHTSRRIIAPLLLGSLGASICFFGAAYLVILGTIQQVAMPALVKAGYSLLGISGLIAVTAPATSYYQGSLSYAVNKQIDQDISQKTIHGPLSIAPRNNASFLIFCKNRSVPLKWNVILNEQETQQPLLFAVHLNNEGVSHA